MLNAIYKDQLIRYLCRFVRIPSRSFPEGGEEGALQALVAEEMRALGARVRTFEPDEVPGFLQHPLCFGPGRNYKNRPTVIGELGPAEGPALLVMAHSDTVPISQPAAWTFDPFCGEIRDGMICGLGSRDDKWGMATMMTIMRVLRDSGRPKRKRLIFTTTIDEENGVGNGLLLLMLAGIRAEAAFYLDGRNMDLCIGNCGGSNMYLRPKAGVKAAEIERTALRLEQICLKISRERETLFHRPYYEHSDVRNKSVMFYRKEDVKGPFFLLGFYTVPGETREIICRQLEAGTRAALDKDIEHYTINYREPWFEPALIAEHTPLIQLVAASVNSVLKRPARIATVPKQDSFIMNNYARIPTISFGLNRQSGRGVGHNPDEAVPISDAWKGCQIVYESIKRWLTEERMGHETLL